MHVTYEIQCIIASVVDACALLLLMLASFLRNICNRFAVPSLQLPHGVR